MKWQGCIVGHGNVSGQFGNGKKSALAVKRRHLSSSVEGRHYHFVEICSKWHIQLRSSVNNNQESVHEKYSRVFFYLVRGDNFHRVLILYVIYLEKFTIYKIRSQIISRKKPSDCQTIKDNFLSGLLIEFHLKTPYTIAS
jgi:hypothetical protein